ncbi:MAG TPA: tyrosine-type recombinase/integrase [Capillimicrobium sp.]|nr:tyrosine-type recombinase/integrase [Capillimicrobium sp.]
MARKSTGGIVEKQTSRGTSYGIRFRALGRRQFVHLGYSSEGWTRKRAEEELANALADVRRGQWRPPAEAQALAERERVPTFHAFASSWLARREPELRPNTRAAYRWELTHHLLPFFVKVLKDPPLDAITAEHVDRYRQHKVKEGRLGAASINKTITRLAQILDDAVEYGHLDRNPARGRRRKLREPRPSRPWLEPDQVVALLDAAGELDRGDARGLPVRRPLLATLALAGLRIGELAALRWRDVDLAAGRLRVGQAKTDAGVRTVDLQPELRDELAAWRAATPHAGRDDLVFVTRRGTAVNRHNVRQRVVLPAAARASQRLEECGLPPLPDGLSPHALRRSFASWLIAEGEDVAYVMEQMGHADPQMTLGVYARAVRSGRRSARTKRRLEALDVEAPSPSPGTTDRLTR